jgi:serine protease
MVVACEEANLAHTGSIGTSSAESCYKARMRPRLALSFVLGLTGLVLAAPLARADRAPYLQREVLVRYQGQRGERELKLPDGVSVPDALRSLRENPKVAYANPNYLVRAAGGCGFPDDRGSSGKCGHWTDDQWNFLGGTPGGVDAPGAWQHLFTAGAPGGRGVKVALLDTGVAYRKKGHRFRKDPDLPGIRRFVNPKDFVDDDRLPLDEDGHGTHVASTIIQSTNNRKGLTGLAYGVKEMPIRVLGKHETGTGSDVARGIRFAVHHGADVINLSLEFGAQVQSCDQIKGVCEALNRASSHGVTVVAAAGNKEKPSVAYPGAAAGVIAVGATTVRGCLADYSDYGDRLDLVAPGGGSDRAGTGELDCNPSANALARDVRQYSLKPNAAARGNFRRFGFVGETGTSMATAHVSAAAALVLASQAFGSDPSAVAQRLECTADERGVPLRDEFYGYGLLDAARATDPAVFCAWG